MVLPHLPSVNDVLNCGSRRPGRRSESFIPPEAASLVLVGDAGIADVGANATCAATPPIVPAEPPRSHAVSRFAHGVGAAELLARKLFDQVVDVLISDIPDTI